MARIGHPRLDLPTAPPTLDATNTTTPGHQLRSLFHGYYDQHQYFPVSNSDEIHIRHRVASRHGTDLLRGVRVMWTDPRIVIHVGTDSGYRLPRMYEGARATA